MEPADTIALISHRNSIRLRKTACRYPKTYLGLTGAAALLGYTVLLSFPLLALAGGINIAAQVLAIHHWADLQIIGAWILLTAVGLQATITLRRLKLPRKNGLQLHYPSATPLFQAIEQIFIEADTLQIDRVIISGRYEIEIVKEPLFAIPVWSRNTLVIGLPLMQSLSPEHFQCILARKLLQYSKTEYGYTNWIRQLRDIWPRYRDAFAQDDSFPARLLYWFFAPYCAAYRELTIAAAHMDELNADSKALHVVNEEDVFHSMQAQLISRMYLEKNYWPMINRIAAQASTQALMPYGKLESVLKNALATNNTAKWLEYIYNNCVDNLGEHPTLKKRMHNIGRSKVKILDRLTRTAAEEYLQQDYVQIMHILDESWRRTYAANQLSVGRSKTKLLEVKTPRSVTTVANPVVVSRHAFKSDVFN